MRVQKPVWKPTRNLNDSLEAYKEPDEAYGLFLDSIDDDALGLFNDEGQRHCTGPCDEHQDAAFGLFLDSSDDEAYDLFCDVCPKVPLKRVSFSTPPPTPPGEC